MMEQNKVSIIIPVYNVEKYLRRCLDSVIVQTYTDLEIILVNDGSKDNSLSICEEYRDNDNRIQIIDKPNGGLSSARNVGLNVASGQYISFVDSDDYIDNRMIETMLNVVKKYNVKAMQMRWTEFETDVNFTYSDNNKLINKDIKAFLLKDNNLYCVVRYLYDRSLIGDYRFDETMRIAEDQKFNYDVLSQLDEIAVSDYSGYFYYQNTSSISNGQVRENHYGDLEYRKQLMNNMPNKKLRNLAKAHLLKGYLGFYIKSLVCGTTCKEDIITKYGKMVRRNYFNYLFLPNIGLKRKMAATCCLLGNKFTKKIAAKMI